MQLGAGPPRQPQADNGGEGAEHEGGDTELQEELRRPVRRERPREPTAREQEQHEDECHANFRAWCPTCVEARALGGETLGTKSG